jgi:hypothetical protein
MALPRGLPKGADTVVASLGRHPELQDRSRKAASPLPCPPGSTLANALFDWEQPDRRDSCAIIQQDFPHFFQLIPPSHANQTTYRLVKVDEIEFQALR